MLIDNRQHIQKYIQKGVFPLKYYIIFSPSVHSTQFFEKANRIKMCYTKSIFSQETIWS